MQISQLVAAAAAFARVAPKWSVAALASTPVVLAAQSNAPKPFALGEVFIDANGDTLQIVKCMGEGWQLQCEVRRLAESGKAASDPSGRWWSIDTLRGSEWQWTYRDGAPYSGPAVPLPTTVAPAGARAPAKVAPATTTARTATGGMQPTGTAAGRVCPKSTFGGPVPGTTPPSAALFQRKITDSITKGSIGPGWYGVQLANFKVGASIRNSVSNVPGVGAMRVNTAAPVNATMYPVSTTMTVCEGWAGGSGSWRTSAKKYLCFINRDGEWVCGASS